MKLAKTLRLDRDDCGGDCRSDWEIARVDDLDRAAAAGYSGDFFPRCKVYVGAVCALEIAVGEYHFAGAGRRWRDNVWIRFGSAVEYGRVDAKVLCEYVFRGVRDPVVNHEGRACGVEIAVVEGEEVFVLGIEAVDCVGNAFGEIPYIARA